MVTIDYMDLYDETQAEGGADSCKYLLKDIQAHVNFTAMEILGGDEARLWWLKWHGRNRVKRQVEV